VRLPVDWLGPRDELVPIGPPREDNASDRRDQTAPRTDRQQLRALTEQPTIPPSAADFWGERAEAVQDVLQGPAPPLPARDVAAPGPGLGDVEPPPPKHRDDESPPPARRGVEPRPPTQPATPPSPTLPSRGAQRARAIAHRAAATWRRRALASPQWGRVIAAAGVMAGVAALIGANVFTSSPGGSSGSHITASTAHKARELHPVIAPAPSIPRLLTGPKHRASTGRHTHAARRQKHTRRPSSGHSGSAGGATPVRYPAPPASSGSGGSSSSPGSSTSPALGSSSPSSTSGSAGSSGTSSSSSSGSASSSGTVAPRQSDSSARSASASHSSSSTSATGASGALGPVGSPNG
jgi:hypothetical protein